MMKFFRKSNGKTKMTLRGKEAVAGFCYHPFPGWIFRAFSADAF